MMILIKMDYKLHSITQINKSEEVNNAFQSNLIMNHRFLALFRHIIPANAYP
jgi:hypothetical protein